MKRALLSPVIIAVIALGVFLGACGGEAAPAPPSEPAPSSLPAATPAPEPAAEPTLAPSSLPAQSSGKIALDGDVVYVHYRGTLSDGTVFDSSLGGEPLEFTLGEGGMIPGFENAVRGMKVGGKKTVSIPAAEAYGPYLDDNVFVVGRDQLQPGLEPEVGQQLQMIMPNGAVARVVVTEVGETTITIDTNHPLAGQDLTFEIMLVAIG